MKPYILRQAAKWEDGTVETGGSHAFCEGRAKYNEQSCVTGYMLSDGSFISVQEALDNKTPWYFVGNP